MASSASKTILVVEDEAFVREVTCEILRSAGYNPVSANNAAEAENIFLASHTEIGLLLTDIILPGETGRELAAKLRRSCTSLKVLFVTGYPEQMNVAKNWTETCLAKPFSAETLLRNIEDLLSDSVPESESDFLITPACGNGGPAGSAREFQAAAPLD